MGGVAKKNIPNSSKATLKFEDLKNYISPPNLTPMQMQSNIVFFAFYGLCQMKVVQMTSNKRISLIRLTALDLEDTWCPNRVI